MIFCIFDIFIATSVIAIYIFINTSMMIQSHQTIHDTYVSIFKPIDYEEGSNDILIDIDIFFVGHHENYFCGQLRLHERDINVNELKHAISQLMNHDILLNLPNENEDANLHFDVIQNGIVVTQPIVQLSNVILINTHNQQWSIHV